MLAPQRPVNNLVPQLSPQPHHDGGGEGLLPRGRGICAQAQRARDP